MEAKELYEKINLPMNEELLDLMIQKYLQISYRDMK